jgi:hypothetical protein
LTVAKVEEWREKILLGVETRSELGQRMRRH